MRKKRDGTAAAAAAQNSSTELLLYLFWIEIQGTMGPFFLTFFVIHFFGTSKIQNGNPSEPLRR